jgi:hypothetical protein
MAICPTLTLTPQARVLRILLWTAQALLGASFVWGAYVKLTLPIAQLAAMWPWTDDLPVHLVRLLGMIDLAGGLGVTLPAWLRIVPGVTLTAARGCALLQVCAMVFHATRGEFGVLPVNLVLFGLALLIAWGRARN